MRVVKTQRSPTPASLPSSPLPETPPPPAPPQQLKSKRGPKQGGKYLSLPGLSRTYVPSNQLHLYLDSSAPPTSSTNMPRVVKKTLKRYTLRQPPTPRLSVATPAARPSQHRPSPPPPADSAPAGHEEDVLLMDQVDSADETEEEGAEKVGQRQEDDLVEEEEDIIYFEPAAPTPPSVPDRPIRRIILRVNPKPKPASTNTLARSYAASEIRKTTSAVSRKPSPATPVASSVASERKSSLRSWTYSPQHSESGRVTRSQSSREWTPASPPNAVPIRRPTPPLTSSTVRQDSSHSYASNRPPRKRPRISPSSFASSRQPSCGPRVTPFARPSVPPPSVTPKRLLPALRPRPSQPVPSPPRPPSPAVSEADTLIMEDEKEVGPLRFTWTPPPPDPPPQRPAPPPWAHDSEPSSSEDEEEDEKHDEEYEYEEWSGYGTKDEPYFRIHSSSPLVPIPPSYFSHLSLNQPTFNAPPGPDAPQAAPAQQWVRNDPPPPQNDAQPSPEEIKQWLDFLKAHPQQQPEDPPLDDFLNDADAAAAVESRSTDDVLDEVEAVLRGVQTRIASGDGERPDVVEELKKLVELVGRCLERWPAEDEAGEPVLEMLRGWDSQLKFWHVTESAYFTPHKEIRKIDDLMYGYFRDLSDSTTSVQHPDDERIAVDSVHFALLPEICFHRCMRRREMSSVEKSKDVHEDILESDAKRGRLHSDWDTPLLQADWNLFSCFFDFEVRAALFNYDEPDGQDSTSPSLPETTVLGSPSPLQSTFNDRPYSHQQPEPSQTLPSPPAFKSSSPSSPHRAVEQAEEHAALPIDTPFDAGAFNNASFAFEDYEFGTFDYSGLDLSTDPFSFDLPAAADPFAFEAGPAGEPAFSPFSYCNHDPSTTEKSPLVTICPVRSPSPLSPL